MTENIINFVGYCFKVLGLAFVRNNRILAFLIDLLFMAQLSLVLSVSLTYIDLAPYQLFN